MNRRSISRRGFLRGAAAGGLGVAGLWLIGCAGDDESTPTSTPPAGATATATETATATSAAASDGPVPGPAQSKELVEGWYRERGVRYYDFGMHTTLASGSSVAVAPIWAFIHGMNDDGSPRFVEGQHNVVDVVPGDDGYSDLWEVRLVTVPEDYEPDSIRSREALEAAGFDSTPAGLFVNCPIVPEGTTLEGGEPLTQGWYRDQAVFYPDFGPNPPVAIPIWAFITGMSDDGSPRFVEGQRNVIDSVPDDDGYSAFWRVQLISVPEGYEANSIMSADSVREAGLEVTQTDLVVNCPVTEVDQT